MVEYSGKKREVTVWPIGLCVRLFIGESFCPSDYGSFRFSFIISIYLLVCLSCLMWFSCRYRCCFLSGLEQSLCSLVNLMQWSFSLATLWSNFVLCESLYPVSIGHSSSFMSPLVCLRNLEAIVFNYTCIEEAFKLRKLTLLAMARGTRFASRRWIV